MPQLRDALTAGLLAGYWLPVIAAHAVARARRRRDRLERLERIARTRVVLEVAAGDLHGGRHWLPLLDTTFEHAAAIATLGGLSGDVADVLEGPARFRLELPDASRGDRARRVAAPRSLEHDLGGQPAADWIA